MTTPPSTPVKPDSTPQSAFRGFISSATPVKSPQFDDVSSPKSSIKAILRTPPDLIDDNSDDDNEMIENSKAMKK
eukprot:CAMPEP_0168589980 /NCGR_PEP_ID=MMETSP0420-20121227/6308_1 /TAXON_ID=498008 /ORGANISM="Pessonella sp." /LENGTH=74 /DNA_ID=CAMNT_0008625577 /DNA_START=176 /DNA_END=401 /DNA_ORIENTATION=+